MEYLDYFSKAFSSLSGLGFLVGIVVLWKTGLLEFIINLKKNGKNGEVAELKDEIKNIKENHLHEINERLTALEVKMDILLKHFKL